VSARRKRLKRRLLVATLPDWPAARTRSWRPFARRRRRRLAPRMPLRVSFDHPSQVLRQTRGPGVLSANGRLLLGAVTPAGVS